MSKAMAGDVVFSHKRKGLYPWLVKYFTGGPSHCFFLAGEFMDHLCALESDLKCQLVPWAKEYGDKQEDNYEAWRPTQATPDMIRFASKSCFFLYAGEVYGFLQLLYWPWRAFKGIFGFKNSFKNSFPAGLICSEILLIYIRNLGGPYEAAVEGMGADTTSPADIRTVVLAHPELFEKIEIRDLGQGAWRPTA